MSDIWENIAKKRRCLSHKAYVRDAMAQLTSEIANEAIATGIVDLEKRKKLLRYKDYYEKL